MEGSQAFQSCHFAVPSPCGLYIASLTQQNLYVQYARSLSPAFTFPLDDPSQPKIIAENQSIQWSPQSTYLMLVSTQGVHAYSLQDSSINIHVSNGSGSLGKIHGAEVLSDSGREQLMVVWEFGRVNLWDLATGRALEVGDLKMGGKGNPWALRRQQGRSEVLVLLMRRDAQDVLSFYLPPSLTPFRSVTLTTIDAQAVSWSTCGRWLSVLDCPLNSQPVHIFTPDGFLFRQYPSLPTPPSTPGEESISALGFKSTSWSQTYLALSTASAVTLLSSKTFSQSSSIPLSSIHTSQRSLEDAVIAYQEIISASGQRSFDTLTGQLIPLPNLKTSITDVRFNTSGTFLSCRDEGNDTAVYIIDIHQKRVHNVLIQHSAIRRAVWHPLRPSLLLVLSEDGSLHVWDVENSQPPIQIPHSFDAVVDKGRVEARWIARSQPQALDRNAGEDTTETAPSQDKLAILLTTRKAGFQLLWPEGRPDPSLEPLRASVAVMRGGEAETEEGDISHDSLYEILTGRTPLPELKVQQVEKEVDMERTEKLDDTFREKVQSMQEEKKVNGLMGESLEDDSEIF
ncbi:Hypothetical protein D9617_16g013950 [Elsinoe fawcettii]|nr:Hypothetical protein D9617_16g013950 [Elsinoe fawcettii]